MKPIRQRAPGALLSMVAAVLGLISSPSAFALSSAQRVAFAEARAREAIQILNSSLTNPELRDEEVRAILVRMARYVNQNGIKIATPRKGKYCASHGALAYVTSDQPDTIVFCSTAYQYDNPQYVIHELYHVIEGNLLRNDLEEECMADLVSQVSTLTANHPEDLPITAKVIPGSYRGRCGETYRMRPYRYHLTLAEQAEARRRNP